MPLLVSHWRDDSVTGCDWPRTKKRSRARKKKINLSVPKVSWNRRHVTWTRRDMGSMSQDLSTCLKSSLWSWAPEVLWQTIKNCLLFPLGQSIPCGSCCSQDWRLPVHTSCNCEWALPKGEESFHELLSSPIIGFHSRTLSLRADCRFTHMAPVTGKWQDDRQRQEVLRMCTENWPNKTGLPFFLSILACQSQSLIFSFQKQNMLISYENNPYYWVSCGKYNLIKVILKCWPLVCTSRVLEIQGHRRTAGSFTVRKTLASQGKPRTESSWQKKGEIWWTLAQWSEHPRVWGGRKWKSI